LYIGLQLYRKTCAFQGLLKTQLLIVTLVDRIGVGQDNFALLADQLPEPSIIELAAKLVSGGVIDILYIGKYRNFFQFGTCIGKPLDFLNVHSALASR
jgi:hypothetical protein